MLITQLSIINKILTADCKSFVLLEVEYQACLKEYELDLNTGLYSFILEVLNYRGILTKYKYDIVNNLYKKSVNPEPANDLPLIANLGNGVTPSIPSAVLGVKKC